MKNIIIKITRSGPRNGPFNIYDQYDNLIASSVSKEDLIIGKGYTVDDDVSIIKLSDVSACNNSVSKPVTVVYSKELTENNYIQTTTACLWRHLTDITKFNYFYGETHSYILEHLFTSSSGRDHILHSVKDYTTAYTYSQDDAYILDRTSKVETDDKYFNKAVVYNGQQSSGTLEMVPKPEHNLKNYMSYPIIGTSSKTILFTKSDSFYNFNTYWDAVKDRTKPLFTMSCSSMSLDKEVNQSNMDYTSRSFNKSPLRAKYAKVRMIKDDENSTHLVTNFILTTEQISYK